MTITFVDVIVGILFAILAIAVIGWIGIITPGLRSFIQSHKHLSSVVNLIFSAAPDPEDLKKASEPVDVVFGGLLPIILWILIVVPMFVFPIILIIFPLLHIPWSYLLPPTP
jgi:hypothetical protein